jgi:hypothetical protein
VAAVIADSHPSRIKEPAKSLSTLNYLDYTCLNREADGYIDTASAEPAHHP